MLLIWTVGSPANAASANPPELSLENLKATRARPLFAPNRRPPAPPPVAVTRPVEAKPPAKKKVPVLRGIIKQSRTAFVLLEDDDTSETVVIPSGGTFGPWKVLVATERSVLLTSKAEEIRLDLDDDEEPDADDERRNSNGED